ncbi:MAG: hypothetical protein RJA99_562 [Pseudomonadota bacterium]|jgi:hypothetical protein
MSLYRRTAALRLLAVALLGLGAALPAAARAETTFHVRTDGGPPSRCDGRSDAPAAGAQGRACAWSHPFHALPPGGPARIAGGDRLVIADGAYMMGHGAPGAEGCSRDFPWDCHMPPVPSGPDAARPTRIVGAGHASGCRTRPELWGTERARTVLNLTGSSNVELACLEVTDRSPCVEFHSGSIRCKRDAFPYGPWAGTGLIASDSRNVRLVDLDIHGLAGAGVRAGRIADWASIDLRIAANGWVGWDGDIGEGGSSNSGTLRFVRWVVEWNGCGETYPQRQPVGCWGQTAGGYGDGVGTARTGGHWIVEDSVFRYNTSDGLDLLYLQGDGRLTIDRVVAEGNAGNQIKARGPTTIRNAVVAGHCAFFRGKPFTHHVDDCRAMGDAVSLALDPGQVATLTSSTVYGEGNCLVVAGGDASTRVVARNTILAGGPFALRPGDTSCWYYSEGGVLLQTDYLLIHSRRGPACPGGTSRCADPLLASTRAGAFDPRLRDGSPARDSGAPVGGPVPAVDVWGTPRPAGAAPDRGAVEMPVR